MNNCEKVVRIMVAGNMTALVIRKNGTFDIYPQTYESANELLDIACKGFVEDGVMTEEEYSEEIATLYMDWSSNEVDDDYLFYIINEDNTYGFGTLGDLTYEERVAFFNMMNDSDDEDEEEELQNNVFEFPINK